MLVIDDLTLRIAGRTLLEHASASIPTGARVGLVGTASMYNPYRTGTDANVASLDGADEGFGHAIALRALNRRCSRLQPDFPNKATGLPSDIAATIVGQAFDGDRQTIDQPEAVLDRGQHEVAHVVTRDAARCGKEAHGFTITAVESESDPDLFAVVAADLEAIRAPAAIPLIHRNAAVMTTLGSTGVAVEQQAMDLHDPIDSLVIGRLAAFCQGLAFEDGVDTPIPSSQCSSRTWLCRAR
jgi:hypothetical protein